MLKYRREVLKMSEWDETDKAMGWNDPTQESKFVSLNEGDNEVVTYNGHEHVPCTDEDKYCDPSGETIQYYFTSPLTGKERTLRRHSKGLFYAFKNAKVEQGQTVQIIRTGQDKDDTRYEIKVLSDAEVAKWKEEKEKAIKEAGASMPEKEEEPKKEDTSENEEINIEDIPF